MFKTILREWTDVNAARYELARALGIIDVSYSLAEPVITAESDLTTALQAMPDWMAAAEILQVRTEPAAEYRWNPDFEWHPEELAVPALEEPQPPQPLTEPAAIGPTGPQADDVALATAAATTAAAASVPVLLERLEETDPRARRAAATALQIAAASDREAAADMLPTLIDDLLSDPDRETRQGIGKTLGRIAAEHPDLADQVTDTLLETLRSEPTRADAVEVDLQELGPEVVPHLLPILEENVGLEASGTVLGLLAQKAQSNPEAAQIVLDALSDQISGDSPRLRRTALELASQIGDQHADDTVKQQAFAILTQALESDNLDVKQTALQLMGTYFTDRLADSPRIKQMLTVLSKAPMGRIRTRAADLLALIE
ncbi:MAG: HEAT repeat domain-containing protein [Anaerolineae bacterium]